MDEDVKELIGGLAEEMRRGFAKVDARFENVESRLDRVDSRLDRVDSRLDRVDSRLDNVDARFDSVDSRFAKLDAKIDDKFEEAKRHFGVLADDLRSQIQGVAESVEVVDQKLDQKIDRLDERLTEDLSEIKSMIPISFTQLDGRIRSLETDNADLQSRVERLESAAH